MFNKTDLTDRKSNLSDAKRALLEKRIKGQLRGEPISKGIPRRTKQTNVPLSYAQQRLWFLYQLEPESPYYNIPTAVRLRGTVHVDLLERSLNEVVSRHESLRTTFGTVDEVPIQKIAPELFVPLERIDLLHLLEDERETAAVHLAYQEAGRSFNIEQGPLIRALIAQVHPQDYMLFFNVHHIVTDGWSSQVLVTELAAVYDALSAGKPSPLPPLPIQYADFAVWQRDDAQKDALDKQLSYWKRQLGGHLPILQLPTDHPRPAVQTFNGDSMMFTLDKSLTDRLKQLAEQNNATLFMVLLAAFDTLLYRYTGEEDLLVGTPIANRNRGELEGLIGFFANTLVLRTAMSDEMTFRELMGQVRQVALDAYANQDTPFEQLVEVLQPERNMAQSPLFQVMFIHQKNRWIELNRDGMSISPMEITSKTSKFDLSLFMMEWPDVVEAAFEYNTDLFEEATIARMKDQLLLLLETVAEQPDLALADLPLLGAVERQQLLTGWNDTQVAYRTDVAVHQLFEEQAARTPDETAVVFRDESLTYRELNEHANRLAHALRERGVGPDVCVGLCMERSLDMVVGVVGILKAGGAYVSLDPNYPEDRLAFMLEDTQVPVLVTHSALAERFTQGDGQAAVLFLDCTEEWLSTQSMENVQNISTVDNLAYVLYTSGSTGRPKGVQMVHGVLANLIQWQLETTVIPHGARTLQFASLNFDVSFQELFTTLCSGGALYIVEEEIRRDPVRLLRFLDERAVERMFLPFVAFQQLAEAASGEDRVPAALREIITAGEQLQVSRQIVKWLSQTPGVVVHNQYGPSESHVVTAYTLTGSPKKWPALPPIGRPIDNAKTYILDSRLQPVPIGVPGELYLAGPVLARGYLQRPDLTAERFLADPFVNDPQARMYKTGDLARFLPDGNIEFLGRADQQVKIRGYRIELGEVEAVLTQHPSVREAVAMAREDVPGDKRLVAYLVVDKMEIPESIQLRRFLLARLPEYMVPSAYLFLDALPLTPSGKLDRRALPTLDRERDAELQRTYVAPRNPVEEVMAGIWADVLRLERVGVMDNFFELGGHSLLATQVVSRIKDVFAVEMPLRKVFEHPMVSSLALAVEEAGQMKSAPPILPVDRSVPLPLSFAQERLWFFEQLQPGTATYNLPNIIRMDGYLNVEALEYFLQELIRRHEAIRTTFEMVDGQPMQVVRSAIDVPLRLIDLTEMPATEREAEALRLATEEVERPFDICSDPLVRATLLRLEETDHVLVLMMHHICSDGWSMGVLVQELVALYGAFVKGRPSPLRPLPIQYGDFSIWQRNWLSGEVLEEQFAYWKQQLGGELPLLELPTDHPRPMIRSYRGGSELFTLSAKLTQALRNLCQREGVTMYMLLLAAFQVLMYRYSGQDDILVGSPIANRNRGEIEGLIGFFVNTLVMRSDLSGDPSFQGLLKRVRKTTIDAYAHQDLPFEKLVEELQPERNMSFTPLFQVLFVLQNAPMGTIELPGLTVSPWNIGSGTSKFDLSVFLVEEDGGMVGMMEYNADLFEPETVKRFTEHFMQLLTSICTAPERAISTLPLMPEEERQKVLVEWNRTEAAYPQVGMHHVFEEQVARTPDAIAVEYGDVQVTYRELNERANRLAHHLQKCGVVPNTLVGLCMERSIEVVVGMLGILKAGGGFVPLDSNYPSERLAHMLRDADVPVLVAQAHLLERLPEHHAHVVVLNADGDVCANESAENLSVPVTGENIAYVMYTSGSTGTPKGVVIRQCGVVSLVKANSYADFSADRVFLQVAPIAFDVSTFEIWGALLNGAKLVMAPAGKLSLEELGAVIERHQVDTVWLTAGLFHQMVDEQFEKLRPVKQLLAGGDVLSPVHVRKVLEGLPNCVMINGYGPTESTTFATCYPMREVGQVGATTPIGYPLANTKLYVLDGNRQPVPIGVHGELYIGGDGLALGYLNRPDLTEERFVRNPFVQDAGAKMYKSGDQVRYRADGTLEFLGRIDNQVKIRGFRIELGEIEAALEQHPEVSATAVLARHDIPGDKRLVAYAALHETEAATVGDLRRFLQEKLPEHLVPSAFVILDAFPLTANGKLDRRALPAPDASRQAEAEFVALRTETELRLAGIWRDVLRVEQVSLYDSFFELGGHSLLATQLLSRLRQEFHVELPLRVLFEQPTLFHLAARIDQSIVCAPHAGIQALSTAQDEVGREMPPVALSQGDTIEQLRQRDEILLPAVNHKSLVPIQPQGELSPFFCMHPVGGHVLCYSELSRMLGHKQPFYGMQAVGLDHEEEEPLTDIRAMAVRYVAELRTVQEQGPYHLGGWSLGGIIAFEMARQLRQAGHDVASLVLIDSFAPALILMSGDLQDTALLQAFAHDLAGSYGAEVDVPEWFADLERLTTEEALRLLFRQAVQLKIMADDEASYLQFRRLYRVFRANLQAVQSYEPEMYEGPLTLLRASERPSEAQDDERFDLSNGWDDLVGGEFTIREVPGDHFTILQQPRVQELARQLQQSLRRHGNEQLTASE